MAARGRPKYFDEAKRRMQIADVVEQFLRQGGQQGAGQRRVTSPPSPAPARDPREGELRSQRVAQTGPRKGSAFTEIVRNGRVFHKYGDDVGAGLGPEQRNEDMQNRITQRKAALERMMPGSGAAPMPQGDQLQSLLSRLRKPRRGIIG